ncbi:MAG: hypothetical protein ACOQNV_00945 [Mycoplasmoidaceae bacterium]
MKKVMYNVENTSNDNPNISIDWIDALEKTINKVIPNKENKVGGHMSSKPRQSGASSTEQIVAIDKDDNALDSNEPIVIDDEYSAPYEEVKKH